MDVPQGVLHPPKHRMSSGVLMQKVVITTVSSASSPFQLLFQTDHSLSRKDNGSHMLQLTSTFLQYTNSPGLLFR
jgi:hypothetical protein